MAGKASMALVVGAALLLATSPTDAHHAIAAEFDETKPITFSGTIVKVEWMNPHIYTQVEVKEPDGSVIVYRVEGGPPNALYRQGWRKEDLKVGEAVTVSGIKAKIPASKNIGRASITTSDGRRLLASGNRGGGPQ